MFQETIYPLLMGALTGIICIGGLYFGVKTLFKAQEETEDVKARRGILLMQGVAALIGQFVLAGLIVMKSTVIKDSPMVFACGLLSINLLIPLLLLRGKKEEK